MASTSDPDAVASGRVDAPVKGHDIKSLGPSDTSDSGSDMACPGTVMDEDALDFDRGTNQDIETGIHDVADAGPSVGDLGLDSDSDSVGTGEHLTAGTDPRVRPNADRDTDRIVDAAEAGLGRGLDQAEEAQLGISDEDAEEAAGDPDEP